MSREGNEYRCGVGDGITLDIYYSRIVFVIFIPHCVYRGGTQRGIKI